MIHVNTRNFGEITIAEEKVLCFPNALPGFPNFKRFALIADPSELEEETAVIYWLQSLDDTDIAFCLVDLAKIMPEYNPLVDEAEISGLGLDDDKFSDNMELMIYNMAVIPEDPRHATVNMKAPIIINMQTMQGIQVICQNEDYAIRQPLVK